MPTLHWIGKEKVINHHMDVPYRVLEHAYGFDNGNQSTQPTNSGNKIIHGDNLEALKSLLPEYEGKIKCIYIDPPYNTGNEGWVYNDNVNDPKIKKWLGQVVGKESEDLSRHDKWLCMMYPRLKLLHKLLAEDGAIFISIDDNEQTNLKLILDEIFGKQNYISSMVWRRRTSSQMSQTNISVDHEYIVGYFKTPNNQFIGTKKDYKNYSNPDNDPRGPWTLGDLTVGMTKEQRPNQYYELIDPVSGRKFPASSKRVWTYAPDTMQEKLKENRIFFPNNDKGKPMLKRFLSELKTDINPLSSWISNDSYQIGLNSEGTKVIQNIFEHKVFDYPKPISLLELLLSQVLYPNDLVLDSFAGSGTTAHAVLNLNKQDGGNRKFILVEMEDYSETITAERVKRVINGYGSTEATGGSFDFYSLGEPMFNTEGMLNESIGIEKIREYIFYTETQTSLQSIENADNPHFLGKHNDTCYYFNYLPDAETTLDHQFLASIKSKGEQYVIYADNCLLIPQFMAKHNIIFKKIPRDITRF
ncbi:MAG: site-specific DNA-methyltransferase [Alphaproteobacteria bacterium]|nr:site-specific DNA-methyltransferase [Alphaproteobacteria bacterium]